MASKPIIVGSQLFSLFDAGESYDKSTYSGVYYEVLNRILHETKLDDDYDILIAPIKRAQKGFITKKYACYSPGFENFDNPNKELEDITILSSRPINRAIARVISRPSERLVSEINDINQSDVISIVRGATLNATMQTMLDRAGKVFEVNSELESIKMLASNRANLSISFYPDVIDAYKKLGLKQHFPFDSQFSPHTVIDNVICHDSHLAAFELIDNKLKEMKQSGVLKEILGEKYMEDTL